MNNLENDKEARRLNLVRISHTFETQRELADKLDQTPGYINQLLCGHRAIGEKAARKIEKKLGLDKYALDKIEYIPQHKNSDTIGTNIIETPTSLDYASTTNTEQGPNIARKVPLISWVQAGEWAEIIDNLHPGDAEQWIETTAKVKKQAFALRIKGDSMTNPHGSPSLPEGSIVIIQPDTHYDNGNIVVARLNDSMEATIKKLVIDGGERYLKPLNPAYPTITINGNCHIIGRAVRVELDL